MSLTVCTGPIELLHASQCLPLLLAVSHCLSWSSIDAAFLSLSLTVSPCAIELVHVSHCLPWLLAVSHSLFQFDGVAAYLSLPPIIAGYLSLSLPVQ